MEKEEKGLKRLATNLLRPLAPVSERLVLVRTKSYASIFAFILYVGTIISCILFFLVGVIGLMEEAILIFLYWNDFNTWNAWLQGISQISRQIFLYSPISPTSRVGWWFDGLFVYLLLIASMSLAIRYLWRRLRRLFAYTRAKDPKAFAPHPDITFFPSLWFSTEVLSEIKPDDASNLVEENPEIWEATVAAWRQKHPPEPIPLARIQIRLTQRCEIVLTGQNGQTAAFFLREAKYTEILVFFALQPSHEWIAKADFAPLLYGPDASNFNMDVHRLHEEINKKAQEHHLVLLDEMCLGQTEARAIPIRLLDEPKTIQGRSCWRLKPGCIVEIFPALQDQYKQAKEVRDQHQTIDLATREQRIMDLVQEYGAGQGLMGIYQTKGAWEWLKEIYHRYRTMWLFLLTDTAEREILRSKEAPDAAQAAQPLRDAARLYSWAVAAADGLFPKLSLSTRSLEEEGERCLVNALQCYHRLNDRRSARILAHSYRDRRTLSWKPTPAMQEAWPGIFDSARTKKRAH